MSTLFIAGATGYTGRALVQVGLDAGHNVIAHIRPGSPSGDRAATDIAAAGATVDRTPWEEGALTATLQGHGPHAVFALLGTTRAKAAAAAKRGESATYESIDRDLSLMLHRSCAAQSPPPRFVYLSSLGADKPGGNRYMKARYDVEQALQQGSVPWTVARPSFLTGPDRDESRPGERIGAFFGDAALGALAAVGVRGPRDRFASLTGEQVARSLLRIALDDQAQGKFFEAESLRPLST